MGLRRNDFSDIDAAFASMKGEVERVLVEIGNDSVAEAKARGSYLDRTGRLRRSTVAYMEEGTLHVENATPYGEMVEHRGYDVLTGTELYIKDKYGLK